MRGLAVIESHIDLRYQYLALDRDIDESWYGSKPPAHVLRQAAQRIEIIAIDLQRDLCPHAGKQVIQPVGNRLADGHRRRETGKLGADGGHHLLPTAVGALQVDVDLG
ncbi:hypothetical protein FQZ97_1062690 [compost metagenome]